MQQEKITQQQWMLLPQNIRNRFIEIFKIERTGAAEVRDQTVISDGYSQTDLNIITKASLCEYIGSEEETFLRAWEVAISKANYEINPPVGEISKTIEIRTVADEQKLVVEEKPIIEETKQTKNDNTKKSQQK